MKLRRLILALIFVISLTTQAKAEDADFTVLETFAQALKNRDYGNAQKHISANSAGLFNKYSNYDLGGMTPQDLVMVSKSNVSPYRILKVSGTNMQGKTSTALIAMVTEDNIPKIDMQKSLNLGFGPNWQQKINMIEQSYLFAKQNLGEAQSQQLLYTLLQKSK